MRMGSAAQQYQVSSSELQQGTTVDLLKQKIERLEAERDSLKSQLLDVSV